jgi:hypothetical protein
VCALACAPQALASDLVARSTSHEQLRVNRSGVADVRYRAGGKSHREIYWGAINGQIHFRLDRSAGWKSKKINPKAPFVNVCGPYKGPKIPFMVRACTMPNGSHWALQKWPRIIPNYGGQSGPKELRLSHWTGETAVLWAKSAWSWSGQWQQLYGQYTFHGAPVYGELVTSRGYVLDGRGRNIAIESLSSDYPNGKDRWARVNMFLSGKPSGQWCFGVSPKADAYLPDPLWQWGRTFTGRSTVDQYRARVAGPGVSPDVQTYFRSLDRVTYEVPDPTSQSGWRYNEAGRLIDEAANAEILSLRGETGGNCRTIN